MIKEEAYLEQANEALENKAPFSAVVYAFLGLIEVFRDVRDVSYTLQSTMTSIERNLDDIRGSSHNMGKQL